MSHRFHLSLLLTLFPGLLAGCGTGGSPAAPDASGTQDARLLTHAALIASASGDAALAARHRERALALCATLLPSERGMLERVPTR